MITYIIIEMRQKHMALSSHSTKLYGFYPLSNFLVEKTNQRTNAIFLHPASYMTDFPVMQLAFSLSNSSNRPQMIFSYNYNHLYKITFFTLLLQKRTTERAKMGMRNKNVMTVPTIAHIRKPTTHIDGPVKQHNIIHYYGDKI